MSRILFLGNHFISLYATRKELIGKLCNDGHEVYLSLPESKDNEYFENLGCKIIPTEMDRRGVNPFKDLKLIKFYKKMIPQVNPDIVFSYTIKPNIYGAMACNKKGYKQVCNITGTGGTFLKKSLVASICKWLYKRSVKKSYKVFFQNTGDRDFFIQNKMVKDNYDMLPGSGCNIEEHPFSVMPEDNNIKFIFIGRVMKLKGIDQYLECAKVIKEKYPETTFYIAGWNEEPEYKAVVEEYQKQGIVDYIGFRKDIADWIEKCHCSILPSLGGEGVPNVMLESSAMGRICIGSNVNGTADVIEDGKTGYLFEAGNSEDLIKQVEKVIKLSNEERQEMGKLAHEKIIKEFDRKIVIDKYMKEVEGIK